MAQMPAQLREMAGAVNRRLRRHLDGRNVALSNDGQTRNAYHLSLAQLL